MPSSSRPQRRQTRLDFTPLPSSSPATKGYNKQIQDRAAAVTLSSSPGMAKRQKMSQNGSNGGRRLHADYNLPTPVASHQRVRVKDTDEESESGSEPVRSTQRNVNRTSSHQQQRQLDFSNARDPSSFSSPIKLPSSSRPQSSGHAGIFGTQRSRRVVNVSSDEESEEELPSPEKLLSKRKSKKLGADEDNSNARMTRSVQQAIAVDSESEDENIVVSSERAKAIEGVSEEEEDDMPTTAGTQRRERARRKSRDSFIASSPPRMIVESDDDFEIIEPPKKRRRREEVDEDNEIESELETPRRRLKPQRKASQREKNELEEDLEFLEPSSDVENSARKPRNIQTSAKDARQKALEKLKRRRSKQVDEPELEEQEEEEDHGDDGPEEEDFDKFYDDEEDQPQPIKSSQMFREDEYDDGFIDSEEEEENPLGIPDGVPLEFTRYASMKARELFKHAVEWFVQKKINPAFNMNDPIYDLTFKKLDDEVAGLAGSKFKSSVWTLDFKRSLEARPEIAFEQIDRDEGGNWMRDSCDACNRTNHPATYQIQFQGTPYHRETLDEVAQGDDDDEEDSSSGSEDKNDEPSYDSQDREIPPANRIYYVGKFCMSNAQTAHALEHWRYHLNEWIVTWLDKNGYGAPTEVVKRDAWSTKKRGRYANKIADRLEREGVVKQLYHDYRSNIDDARSSKQGR